MNQPIVVRRQRRLSEAISDSLSIVTQHWQTLALIALPAIAINLVVSLVQLAAEESEGLTALVGIVSVVVYIVAFQLAGGALALAINSLDAGGLMSPNEALNATSDRLGDLIWAALRATVIALLFMITIVGIPWGLARLVKWAFISQAIMLDDQNRETALDYSAALVAGRGWFTFWRLVGGFIVIGIPVAVLEGLLTAAFPPLLRILSQSAIETFTIPYGVVLATLLFLDLKLRPREGG